MTVPGTSSQIFPTPPNFTLPTRNSKVLNVDGCITEGWRGPVNWEGICSPSERSSDAEKETLSDKQRQVLCPPAARPMLVASPEGPPGQAGRGEVQRRCHSVQIRLAETAAALPFMANRLLNMMQYFTQKCIVAKLCATTMERKDVKDWEDKDWEDNHWHLNNWSIRTNKKGEKLTTNVKGRCEYCLMKKA